MTTEQENAPHDHPVALPLWLSAPSKGPLTPELAERPVKQANNNKHTPFSDETRQRLARKVQHDPRLLRIIETLQQNIEPGSKEWGWVENFCRDASRQLLESHEHFVKANHCDTEHNLLLLGAHLQEYSFSGLLQQYHFARKKGIGMNENRRYAEAIFTALPIIAAIQPRVAVAYAADINAAYRGVCGEEMPVEFSTGNPSADTPNPVTSIFLDIARENPYLVLESANNFNTFRLRKPILDTAKHARKAIMDRADKDSNGLPTDAIHRQLEMALRRTERGHGVSLNDQTSP